VGPRPRERDRAGRPPRAGCRLSRLRLAHAHHRPARGPRPPGEGCIPISRSGPGWSTPGFDGFNEVEVFSQRAGPAIRASSCATSPIRI
jgi:hypothetical protein